MSIMPGQTAATATGSGADGGVASILVIDDSCLYREGLAAALRQGAGPVEVRTAHDAGTISETLAQWPPHIILLNLASAGSRELLPALGHAAPDSRIVVLGLSEADEEDIVAFAEAGVAGYLMRSEPLEHLLDQIRTVIAGGTMCSPRVAAVLLRRVRTLAAQPAAAGRVPVLTAREDQVLDLVALGLSNRDIAGRLTIETRTVKNHVHNILEKLGVHRRAEAVAMARGGSAPPAPPARVAGR